MTITITPAQLGKLEACQRQRRLFKRVFGDQLIITSRDHAIELAARHAEAFSWWWAARNLLNDTVLADYRRIRATALADYERNRDAAWTDYRRILAAAFAAAFWDQENQLDTLRGQ